MMFGSDLGLILSSSILGSSLNSRCILAKTQAESILLNRAPVPRPGDVLVPEGAVPRLPSRGRVSHRRERCLLPPGERRVEPAAAGGHQVGHL